MEEAAGHVGQEEAVGEAQVWPAIILYVGTCVACVRASIMTS